MKLFTFTVVGAGHFPLDMLRYDSCWPSSQSSVCDMLDENIRYDDGKRRIRTIALSSICSPTVDRWASFGWHIDTKSIQKRTLPT